MARNRSPVFCIGVNFINTPPLPEKTSSSPLPPKLLDQVVAKIRFKHYSRRTEQYSHWIKRYILFHGKRLRHPKHKIHYLLCKHWRVSSRTAGGFANGITGGFHRNTHTSCKTCHRRSVVAFRFRSNLTSAPQTLRSCFTFPSRFPYVLPRRAGDVLRISLEIKVRYRRSTDALRLNRCNGSVLRTFCRRAVSLFCSRKPKHGDPKPWATLEIVPCQKVAFFVAK